jgi:hypothetical protein
VKPALVYHFSEEPSIELFQPRLPAARSDVQPLVWAIDEEHAPLYWFPRDCPRVTFWAGPGTDPEVASRFLGQTAAKRVHAIECAWLDRMRRTQLYAYRFASGLFVPFEEADGHWVSHQEVVPLAVEAVGDLLICHAEAGIELRITPSLWPLHDCIPSTGLHFSIVRMRHALPRMQE